jgi:hypothetical protein
MSRRRLVIAAGIVLTALSLTAAARSESSGDTSGSVTYLDCKGAPSAETCSQYIEAVP